MTRTESASPTKRYLRRYGLIAALAAVALAASASSAAAATKDFSLTISPSIVLAGEVVDIDATFKNLTAQQQFGSANLTSPTDHAVTSVSSLSLPAPASATIVGGVVQLRNLSLAPQATVTVSLKVATPCASGVSAIWDNVQAKQANDFNGVPGNAFVLDRALSSLTTTTTGACTPCPENTSCAADLSGLAGSSLSLVADPSATLQDTGQLTISQLAGGLDCANYAERSTDIFNSDSPQNRETHATLTFAASTRAITSKDPLEVCHGSPRPFAVKDKTQQTTAIIDGQLAYVGRLPNCQGNVSPPCVTGRDNATRSIFFTLPPGDPQSR